MEEFKEIPETGGYSISQLGNVKSPFTNKVLATYVNNKGYVCVKLHIDKQQKTFTISRLLGVAFLGVPSLSSSLEVDHIDGNPANNNLSNLQVLDKDTHLLKTLQGRGFIRQEKTHCSKCGKELTTYRAKTCKPCTRTDITLEEFVRVFLEKGSWLATAEVFGVSDNGLRKIYRRISGGKDPKLVKKELMRS